MILALDPDANLTLRLSTLHLSREEYLKAYHYMALSRAIDIAELDLKKKGAAHFQISGAGHEAIQVAAALQLRAGSDWFFPYYRDRAFCLALGVTPGEMFKAAVGAADDPSSGGRQMPSHWGNKALNIVSQSSVTGTQCLHAVGCAEATVLLRRNAGLAAAETTFVHDQVTVVSLGEGATSEGEFWESLNSACNLHLPIVYIIEDNGYAISVPVEVQTAGGDISRLVGGFPGLKVVQVDGTDFVESYEGLRDALAYARSGMGPAFVHAKVVRLHSHSGSDTQTNYRTEGECAADQMRDPIGLLRRRLLLTGIASVEELDAIAREVQTEVADGIAIALTAPKPRAETAGCWVHSPSVDPTSGSFDTTESLHGEAITMVQAINRTIDLEMRRDARIIVFGQDVADCSRSDAVHTLRGQGGVFKVTSGLQQKYPSRVFNAPIAEANIVGRAVGMSVRGLKPVVEIQFFDYIWSAMMQIRNEVSVMRYRSANAFSCPFVIRVPIGGYLNGGSIYHSQSGESIFAHCPGLRIAFPSNAADAAGLLRTSIRCDDPVLFLEHKHLYRSVEARRPAPGENGMIPFGRASLCRQGEQVLLITWGATVYLCLEAARQADREGISVAVLDLRTIMPYDWHTISAQTRQINRVIIVHEDQLTCGFGAEISARIVTELFDSLDAPVLRVAAMDTPVAYSPELEAAILPQTADVLDAVRRIASY
jgi:2-oxoisovalerate dehydrogenase E1 component